MFASNVVLPVAFSGYPSLIIYSDVEWMTLHGSSQIQFKTGGGITRQYKLSEGMGSAVSTGVVFQLSLEA